MKADKVQLIRIVEILVLSERYKIPIISVVKQLWIGSMATKSPGLRIDMA